jgi:hypothetical protein
MSIAPVLSVANRAAASDSPDVAKQSKFSAELLLSERSLTMLAR